MFCMKVAVGRFEVMSAFIKFDGLISRPLSEHSDVSTKYSFRRVCSRIGYISFFRRRFVQHKLFHVKTVAIFIITNCRNANANCFKKYEEKPLNHRSHSKLLGVIFTYKNILDAKKQEEHRHASQINYRFNNVNPLNKRN